tara:strand:+ start:97 stop:306 length:210 start_codon:yes stop_codon:yes gene_type:complete
MSNNAEIFQAFSCLSDAQEVISFGDSAESINRHINHAKFHLSNIIDGWDSEEVREAFSPYQECGYESVR